MSRISFLARYHRGVRYCVGGGRWYACMQQRAGARETRCDDDNDDDVGADGEDARAGGMDGWMRTWM